MSHFKAKMHQIRFLASVRFRLSVRVLDGVWHKAMPRQSTRSTVRPWLNLTIHERVSTSQQFRTKIVPLFTVMPMSFLLELCAAAADRM